MQQRWNCQSQFSRGQDQKFEKTNSGLLDKVQIAIWYVVASARKIDAPGDPDNRLQQKTTDKPCSENLSVVLNTERKVETGFVIRDMTY